MKNVHDKFFKEIFSQKDVAVSFIKSFLPDWATKNIDFETIELANNSYIDEELAENFADLVYSCEYNSDKKIRISLIFEHKSYREKFPHLQLLKYMMNIWRQDEREKKKKLTLTIPIIIYHGKTRWEKQSMIADFEKIEDNLIRFIPNFDYFLFDISRFSDKEIFSFENQFLSLSTLLMKYSRTQNYVVEIANQIAKFFERIDETQNSYLIQASFTYIYMTSGLTSIEIIKIFKDFSNKTTNIAMTAGEQLIKEGIRRGKQEGKQEGRQEVKEETIIEMYKKGLSITLIAEIFRATSEQITALIKKNNLSV